jgi:S-formylglutathione hydrolase FrmB
LPPAYFADPQPQLPVLVLLAGEPGTPQDWLTAGKLVHIMDRFAADHRGLAPVVVVPDATGSQFGDPLCVDSRRGNADTYLAKDVPAWVKTHLSVDPDPQSWAIAGVSYGGTCALQLATNHPDVYPTFLDISGSAEPSLGDRPRTVADAFGGDQAAFIRVNPLDLLRTRRYRGSAAAIVVGAGDRDTKSDAHLVYAATRAAGMTSHYIELPGSHDWRLFSAALAHELPWLAQRIGLTQQTPAANG